MPNETPQTNIGFWIGAVGALGGAFFLLGGLFAPEKVYFTSEYDVRASPLFTVWVGLLLLYAGGTALRYDGWPRKDADQRNVAGNLCLMIGAGMIALVIFESDRRSFPSGRWAAIIAGMLLISGGALARATAGPPTRGRMRLVSYLGAIVVSLFAVMPLYFAFSPMSPGRGSVSFFLLDVPVPRWIDRVMLTIVGLIFGAVALMAWKYAIAGEQEPE